ncbi:MAG: sel1 repeat family protein [Betaproteobacteria bacterium]|nr:sel1 repeat family protein [Betaproteobacteria bacterium]MBI2509938.1 sel1 repeat family protein [Betaproteobacteria bacterium]
MNASAIKLAALIIAACAALVLAMQPAAAQEKKVNIEDLKIRSHAGERGATRQLAEMYYVGKDGVEQDFAEAARWYEKLAKQGDVRAQTTMGLMYSRGYGVKKDPQAAHRWWNFAAAQNDPGAQYNLGLSYANGDGVAQDHERAVQWYAKAASRGHVQAQHNLGMLYHEGKPARDPVRAYFWVKVAALQGDDVAQDSLKIVRAGMSPAQVAEAETQAEEWMKKNKKMIK